MTYPRYIPITGYPHTYPAAADCPRRQWGTKRKIRGPLVVSNRTWISGFGQVELGQGFHGFPRSSTVAFETSDFYGVFDGFIIP